MQQNIGFLFWDCQARNTCLTGTEGDFGVAIILSVWYHVKKYANCILRKNIIFLPQMKGMYR